MRVLPTLVLSVPLTLLYACSGSGGGGGDDESPPEIEYPDEDGDTIMDFHEGFFSNMYQDTGEDLEDVDTDGDDTPDYLDLDSDDDGIPDEVEAGDDDVLTLPLDSDGDGEYDFRDEDSDDNCLDDEDEGDDDPDDDGIGDYADHDNDGDGILDTYEIGRDCAEVDTDGDGTPDYLDEDSDGDGVADIYEAGTSEFDTEPADTDGDGTPDYLDEDSDGDGFTDTYESGGSEPRDTDGDGLYDFQDTDSDGDGLTDDEERDVYGTDPYDSNTDGDANPDGAEVSAGTDPNDPFSEIDGLYVEVNERTETEEVFEFTLDIQMGDIAFLLDTTGSMSSTLSAMKNEYSAIVSTLSSQIPDAEYGVATFDDYNHGSYGSGQDKPFILQQEITSDVGQVQSALSGIGLHGGGDGPESGMEALYQGLTGVGYDQSCNGSYDSADDVKPFIGSASDPFNGSAGGAQTGLYSGGGDLGGFGFRAYALPVLVYATDNQLRDADGGFGTPGGCPGDAGNSDVSMAARDLGAYLIGVSVSGSTPVTQMNQLADDTSSYADTDGDGLADDRLVFTWNSSSSSQFRSTVTDAIDDLVQSVVFSEIELEIEGDTHGFVVDIDPATYTLSGAATGQVIDFTLTFRGTVAEVEDDQFYSLTLNVLGDGTTLLDSQEIFVLVPGTSY